MLDLNVIYPIDRLHDLAAQGVIGSVADTHFVMGAWANADILMSHVSINHDRNGYRPISATNASIAFRGGAALSTRAMRARMLASR